MTNNNLCKEVFGMFDDCKTCEHDSNELCGKFEQNNQITISFKSDYQTAKKLENLIEKFVSKTVKEKVINFAFVELETNLY